MLRACTVCGAISPEPRCPTHRAKGNGTRNPNRDLNAHNRWAYHLKKTHPYCQIEGCGQTTSLQAHHTHGLNDPRGLVLCRAHHRALDPHAR